MRLLETAEITGPPPPPPHKTTPLETSVGRGVTYVAFCIPCFASILLFLHLAFVRFGAAIPISLYIYFYTIFGSRGAVTLASFFQLLGNKSATTAASATCQEQAAKGDINLIPTVKSGGG